MQAGKLRHRVTIEQRTQTFDANGSPTDTWTAFATVWASVEPLSGRELLNAEQIQPVVSHRVRLRYLSGVQPEMRVLHDSRALNIESVINKEERNIELELLCSEAV